MFHHFHNKKNKQTGQGSLNPKNFKKILVFLKSNYNILSPQKWLIKLKEGKLEKKDICLTFDDALLSQYTVALKILDKFKIKAFWFVYSSIFNGKIDEFEIHRKFRTTYYKNFYNFYLDFIKNFKEEYKFVKNKEFQNFNKYMRNYYPIYSKEDIKFRFIRDKILSKDQYNVILKKMMRKKSTNEKKLSKKLWLNNKHLINLDKKGHIIGMHAFNHPYKLSELNYINQKNELNKNYQHLKKTLKKKPISISYPNGSFNNHTVQIIKKLGIKCAFISSMKNNRQFQKKYVLKRLDHSIILNNLIK